MESTDPRLDLADVILLRYQDRAGEADDLARVLLDRFTGCVLVVAHVIGTGVLLRHRKGWWTVPVEGDSRLRDLAVRAYSDMVRS